MFRAFSGNVPKSANEKKIIARNEFKATMMKGMEGRSSDAKIPEEPFDDCREEGNDEHGEAKVNNDLEENQLVNLHY